jgi:hypothetical protein
MARGITNIKEKGDYGHLGVPEYYFSSKDPRINCPHLRKYENLFRIARR